MAGAEDFSALLVMEGHAAFFTKVHNLADVLTAEGSRAQAVLLERAFEAYFTELRLIGEAVAVLAQKTIVEEERSSRVRPDTEGGGGARLEDYIGESEALPALPGSVGVNNEAMLRSSPVAWWWTNEEGYSGHIGREIQGYFFGPGGGGGGFIPSSHMAGQHPIFKPYGGKAPTGIIEEPIPERRFVEHGYVKVEAEWHARVGRARQAFMAELQRIMALPVP